MNKIEGMERKNCCYYCGEAKSKLGRDAIKGIVQCIDKCSARPKVVKKVKLKKRKVA